MSFQMKDLEVRHYRLRKQLTKLINVTDWQLELIMIRLAAETGLNELNRLRGKLLMEGPTKVNLPVLEQP